jgi:hypothetical protein
VVAITANRIAADLTSSVPNSNHQNTGMAASLTNEIRFGMVRMRLETGSSLTSEG